MNQDPVRIRPARDEDGETLISLLGEVFAEYEGCLLERSELPEMVAPASSFAALDGKIWVAERAGDVLGFVAMAPSDEPDMTELKKLYVRARGRGLGLGRRLVALVEDETRARAMRRVHLWSDTRFLTAHAVYARLGYVKLPETRPLYDVSNSVEFHFLKELPAG